MVGITSRLSQDLLKLMLLLGKLVPTNVRASGLRLIHKNRFLARILGFRYFGTGELDRKLKDFLNPTLSRNGFFVELGANDGITQSNTKMLELFYGWRGILVEPEPNNFEKLLRNRSKKNYFYDVAAVSFDYLKPTMDLKFSNLMTTPLAGHSTLKNREAHAEDGKRFLGPNESTYIFTANVKTLNAIFVESAAPKRMDLLSLDVEGGEFEVLKGINHGEYQFDWLLIESQQLGELLTYLEPLGYFLKETLSTHDYLFQNVNEVVVGNK